MIKFFKIPTLTLICLLNFCLHSMENPQAVPLYSPLLQAIKDQSVEIVKQLLQNGKNPEEDKDEANRTALFLAVIEHVKIFRLILAQCNQYINSIEHMHRILSQEEREEICAKKYKENGRYQNYEKIIKLLLDYGANVYTRDDNQNTPLLYATGEGDVLLVDLLVKYLNKN